MWKHTFLLFCAVCFVNAEVDLIGTYDGSGTFFKFAVNESQPLGGDVITATQINRIDIVEQEGSFVRGAEYWSSDGSSWFFVCYVFGEISQKSNQPNVYSVRLQEYFNKVNTSNTHDQEETLGLLVGYYNTMTEQMFLDYTGQTLSLQMFGAQSFVATKNGVDVRMDIVDAVDIDLLGDYDGVSIIQTFAVNESVMFGSPIVGKNLTSRLSVLEQDISFVRGIEYRLYDGAWIFYCNFFGIIAPKSKQEEVYAVRLQQFLNTANTTDLNDSNLLIGEIFGYYNSTSDIMYIDYTGQTLDLKAFGGESHMSSRSSIIETAPTISIDLIGTYDGSGTFFKFAVNESQPFGGDVITATQINRIDIVEQEGSFVRGAEYWSSDGSSWFFVCYVFGEISQKSNQPNVYSVRLQEYFNKVNTSNTHDQEETLGLLVGYYNTMTEQMFLDYTGQTLSLQMFGAQSFVATKTSDDKDNDEGDGGEDFDTDDTDDLPGGWTTVIVLCVFGGGVVLGLVVYRLHDYYDAFGIKRRKKDDSTQLESNSMEKGLL